MKQWAIKTPKGKLLREGIFTAQYKAWDFARLLDDNLGKMYHNYHSNYAQQAKAKGYRCVRVEVREVK